MTLPPMDVRTLARIQLVSRYYHQLRGLGPVAIGLALVIGSSTYMVSDRSDAAAVIACVIGFGFAIPAMLWVERYYKSRFGRVNPPATGLGPLLFALSFGLLAIVTRAAGLPAAFGGIGCNGALALWILVRDWPHRPHYVAVVLGSALGAAIQIAPAGLADPQSAAASGFLILGVVYIPVGFLDHRLLVSVMHEPAPDTAAIST